MRLITSLLVLFIIIEIAVVIKQDSMVKRVPKSTKPLFSDVLDLSGIQRQKQPAGVSWVDFDNDGKLDLLVSGIGIHLYHNNGDGSFTDVTTKAGLEGKRATVAVFGDYNNDGCDDLFMAFKQKKIPGTSGTPYSLYKNNCNGTFTEVKNAFPKGTEAWHAFGASWADYDNDGLLDLYISNYGYQVSGKEYQSEPNILFHNNGDGTFTDVTEKANVSGNSKSCDLTDPWALQNKITGGPYKESYQPVWFDYNNDGKVDLFVANDSGVSPLYRNNGDGTFTDATKDSGLCRLGSSMGVAVGDYDNDGNLDLYVTNTGANYLWHNKGNGTFEEIAAQMKIADPLSIGWGANFFDYDNDGNLDLYVTNGTVAGQENIWDPNIGKQKIDRLYRNNGDGSFTDVAQSEGISGDDPKEAAAYADFNNDGFLDIYVATTDKINSQKERLYKNSGNKNHWLTVKLTGEKSNKDAVGARIILKSSGKTQIREVKTGSSFISQNSLWQTFGLGSAVKIDAVEIHWPSGIKTILHDIKPDQNLVVNEK